MTSVFSKYVIGRTEVNTMMRLIYFLAFLVLCNTKVDACEVELRVSSSYVFENRPATLECFSNTTGQLWTMNGVSASVTVNDNKCIVSGFLNESLLYDVICESNGTFTVEIKEVSLGQHGDEWVCSSHDDTGCNGSLTLQVQVPLTTVTMESSDNRILSTMENSIETFQCNTSYSRPSPVIKWYRERGTIRESVNDSFVNTSYMYLQDKNLTAATSELIFTTNRTFDTWNVTCEAHTIPEIDTVVDWVQLNITYAPLDQPQIVSFKINDTYRVIKYMLGQLSCMIDQGNPLPGPTWECYEFEDIGNASDNHFPGNSSGIADEGTAGNHFPSNSSEIADEGTAGNHFPSNSSGIADEGTADNHFPNNSSEIADEGTADNHFPSNSSGIADEGTADNYFPINSSKIADEGTDVGNVIDDNTLSSNLSVSANISKDHTFVNNSSSTVDLGPDIGNYSVDNFNFMPWKPIQGIEIMNFSSDNYIFSNISWEAGLGQGLCICKSQYMSSTLQAHVYIDVLYPPTQPVLTMEKLTLTESIILIENQTLTVDCESTGNPPPSIIWEGPSVADDVGHILNISSIKRSQSGNYTCTANNFMVASDGGNVTGVYSTILEIVVLYPAGFSHRLQDTSVLEGNNLTMRCPVAHGNPSDTVVQWLGKSDSIISNDEVLRITNVSRDDAGVYRCSVYNEMEPSYGNTTSVPLHDEFRLNVFFQARVTKLSINGTVPVTSGLMNKGESLIIQCETEGYPVANVSIYMKTGVKRPKGKDKISYTVTHADYIDAGVYVCAGINNLTDAKPSIKEINVIVKCPPRPHRGYSNFTEVYSKRQNTVLLQFRAHPYLDEAGLTTFTWYNGSELVDLDDTRISVISNDRETALAIQNVGTEDFTAYRLYVKNSVGIFEKRFQLLRKEEETESPLDMTMIIVGSSASGGVMVVGVFVVVCCFRTRCCRRENKNSSQKNKRKSLIEAIKMHSMPGKTCSGLYDDVIPPPGTLRKQGLSYETLKEEKEKTVTVKQGVTYETLDDKGSENKTVTVNPDAEYELMGEPKRGPVNKTVTVNPDAEYELMGKPKREPPCNNDPVYKNLVL